MATISGKAIATPRTNHFSPGPPAMSMAPPTPPAGPVPAPFLYIARSSSASDTKDQLRVGGAPVLVNGSSMNIEVPGNSPCQPTGGDVVTHMVNRAAGVFTGSTKVLAGGQQVACTGDSVRLNMPNGHGAVAQTTAMLLMAAMIQMASAGGGTINVMVVLDPISVASGDVVEENVDLAIGGLIPIEWKRLYSTARAEDHTPLGRGGWTHSYHQWVEVDGDVLRLREADGSLVIFPGAKAHEPTFHRGRRLSATRSASGGAAVFSLDTRLTRIFEGRGGGRACLREIRNACGHRVVLEYEAERLARIIDTAGRTVVLTHDRDGHIVRLDVFPPNGDRRASLHTTSFAYQDGELASVTDPLGQVESYAYDAKRRLTRKTLPNDLSFHYLYDPETGRCIRSWGDGGLHQGDLTYELDKGITRLTGNSEPWVFGWQADGSVVRRASADGGIASEIAYDDDGLVIEEKNAGGEAFQFERDARGNVTAILGPLGSRTEMTYQDDLVVRRGTAGVLTEYAYDPRGLLAAVKYASGAHLSLSYDERGRLRAIHGPDGLRVGLVYDEQNNVVEEWTARGGVRRWTYDALGRPVGHVDPVGGRAWRELDALGRPVALRLPDGATTRFAYDALGRLVRRVDAAGRVESFRYAGLRSPIEVTTPDGAVWSLAYDLNERLQQVKNPRGEAFDIRYDRAGNFREIRSFDGRITRVQHGKNGRVARFELPDGTFRGILYDEGGRLAGEESPHGAVKVERRDRTATFTFDDPAGKVIVRFEQDELGRVIAETQNGRTIRYEYDTQNRRTARHLPTGQVTRFFYDVEGNVSALDHEGQRVEIHRDLAGAVLRKVFAGCGLETRRSIDAMQRPVREWTGTARGTLVDRTYAYDATGGVAERNDLRWGLTRYTYDAMGRLLSAQSSQGAEAFEYDAGGSLQPRGAAWETAPGGVLVRAGEVTYAHDDASRRTRMRQDGSEVEYLWDARGRLREVWKPDGTRVLFAYDAFGRRVRKEIVLPVPLPDGGAFPEPPAPRVVEYLWDDRDLIAEIDSERGTRVFVYEPTTMRPLLQQEGDAIHAVVTDHLGTPTELIDAGGEVVWSARHSAWGIVKEVARPAGEREVASPFRLLGQYHDEETGLCYVHFRYFDPETARFLSPDPLELFGGRNLFAFNGSPTTDADPLGLSCIILGNPVSDKAIRYAISNIRPNPNGLTVVVHGAPTAIGVYDANGQWSWCYPNQLVGAIQNTGAYNGEGTIILNSCESGQMANGGVASGVSAAYPNQTVWAPNEKVWGVVGSQDGANVAKDNAGQQGLPGAWNRWQNGAPQQYTPPLPNPPPPAPPAPAPAAPAPAGPVTQPMPAQPSGAGSGSTTMPPTTQPMPGQPQGGSGLPFVPAGGGSGGSSGT